MVTEVSELAVDDEAGRDGRRLGVRPGHRRQRDGAGRRVRHPVVPRTPRWSLRPWRRGRPRRTCPSPPAARSRRSDPRRRPGPPTWRPPRSRRRPAGSDPAGPKPTWTRTPTAGAGPPVAPATVTRTPIGAPGLGRGERLGDRRGRVHARVRDRQPRERRDLRRPLAGVAGRVDRLRRRSGTWCRAWPSRPRTRSRSTRRSARSRPAGSSGGRDTTRRLRPAAT